MATIRSRKLADGTVRYTAQIRVKCEGMQVYQESQPFARKQAAQAWVRKREVELDQPGSSDLQTRPLLINVRINQLANQPGLDNLVMDSAQIRTPLLSVMSVGAHNRQQQVLIPILIMGIDKPYIVVWVIEAGGAVVLAFLSGP